MIGSTGVGSIAGRVVEDWRYWFLERCSPGLFRGETRTRLEDSGFGMWCEKLGLGGAQWGYCRRWGSDAVSRDCE
jgi:hypothetical protein